MTKAFYPRPSLSHQTQSLDSRARHHTGLIHSRLACRTLHLHLWLKAAMGQNLHTILNGTTFFLVRFYHFLGSLNHQLNHTSLAPQHQFWRVNLLRCFRPWVLQHYIKGKHPAGTIFLRTRAFNPHRHLLQARSLDHRPFYYTRLDQQKF